MKTIVHSTIAILGAGILLVSCQQPSSVHANREVEKVPVSALTATLASNMKEVNFGIVPFYPPGIAMVYIPAEQYITISNTDKVSATITSLTFEGGVTDFNVEAYHGKHQFSVRLSETAYPRQLDFPLTLAPKGQEGSSIELIIVFDRTIIGSFHDKLIFNQETSSPLVIPLSADIASVTVDDGTFTATVGASADETISVKNMDGNKSATVVSVSITGPDAAAFSILPSMPPLPALLQPWEGFSITQISRFAIPVRFSPTVPGKEYKAQIQAEIQYSGGGVVKNIGILTGTTE